MANWNDPRQPQQGFGVSPGLDRAQDGVVFDQGLRKHMLSIYNYMASGVLLTGVVALMTAQTGLPADPRVIFDRLSIIFSSRPATRRVPAHRQTAPARSGPPRRSIRQQDWRHPDPISHR